MNRTTGHTGPFSVAQLQTTVDLSTRGASPAGCIPATNANQVDALPSALVLKDRIKPADARISDAISKMSVLEHSLHIQVLNADGAHLAVVRQLMSDLVDIVKPLVGNLGMNICNLVLNFLPSGRTLSFMSQLSLVMLKTLLRSLAKVRCGELTTIGTYGSNRSSSRRTPPDPVSDKARIYTPSA